MAVNDLARVELHYNANEQPFVTVFTYRETVEQTGPDDMFGISIAFAAQILPAFQDLLSVGTRLGCVIARQIQQAGTRKIPATSYFVDTDGTVAGQAAPGNKPLIHNSRGVHQGRPSLGKLKISGYSVDSLVGKNVSPAFTALWNTFAGDLGSDLVLGAPYTGEFEFGFMSRAGVLPADPPVAWPGTFVKPTTFSLSLEPGQLRRRQVRYTNAHSQI